MARLLGKAGQTAFANPGDGTRAATESDRIVPSLLDRRVQVRVPQRKARITCSTRTASDRHGALHVACIAPPAQRSGPNQVSGCKTAHRLFVPIHPCADGVADDRHALLDV